MLFHEERALIVWPKTAGVRLRKAEGVNILGQACFFLLNRLFAFLLLRDLLSFRRSQNHIWESSFRRKTFTLRQQSRVAMYIYNHICLCGPEDNGFVGILSLLRKNDARVVLTTPFHASTRYFN